MIYVNARFLTQSLTGVQRFAEQISLELKKLRDDVVFLSPNNIIREDIASKLDVIKIGKRSGHYWEQVELPRFLKKNKNAILINLGNTGPVFFKNKVVTHHDVTYKKYPQSYSWKFKIIYNSLVPIMLRHSRSVITVSEFSKKEISESYNYDSNNINVIYNSASDVFSRRLKGIESQDKYFLAVSSPNYHKNFHGLVNEFSSLPGLDAFKLKIIGERNKNFNGMNLEIESDKGKGNIEFLGRVSDSELADLYSNAYAFIFPSFYEGFGIPPLEAQACGCPVLSSNTASMPEVLADSVIFFDPNKSGDIASALSYIIENPEVREHLIIKGYENIKRFSWESSAKKLNALINTLNSAN
ncbi:glycosyltransferase family 4 protein [Serratia proteamaculans]|uniref:glycosyltransferase family 4 protein n=1 Tax=Serratia proteamaculans TaxID=28151 RepID=UPI0039BE466A